MAAIKLPSFAWIASVKANAHAREIAAAKTAIKRSFVKRGGSTPSLDKLYGDYAKHERAREVEKT